MTKLVVTQMDRFVGGITASGRSYSVWLIRTDSGWDSFLTDCQMCQYGDFCHSVIRMWFQQ